jgi:plastocyanin
MDSGHGACIRADIIVLPQECPMGRFRGVLPLLTAIAMLIVGSTSVAIGVAHGASATLQAGDPVQIIEPSADIMTSADEPKVVTVGIGQTINWANVGAMPHTVTSPGGHFDSSLLNAGEVFAWTPVAAGTFRYICIYHPWTTGTIVAQ